MYIKKSFQLTLLVLCGPFQMDQLSPRRPNARGMAQHGRPPGWLEVNGPTGEIFYVMEVPYTANSFGFI
jgi:hypothetical protein